MWAATCGNDDNKLARRGIGGNFVKELLSDINEAKKRMAEIEWPAVLESTKIQRELEQTINFLAALDDWENQVLDYILRIKCCISRWHSNPESSREMVKELENAITQMTRLKAKVPGLIPPKPKDDASDDSTGNRSTFEIGKSSSNNGQVVSGSPSTITRSGVGELAKSDNQNEHELVNVDFIKNMLDSKVRFLVYSLAIFPENTELKKRLLIQWWIGMDNIFDGVTYSSMEEITETIFNMLIREHILKATRFRRHNNVIDSCIITPTIHRKLVFFAQQEGHDIFESKHGECTWHFYESGGSAVKAMLNLDRKHLKSKYISKIPDILYKKEKTPKICVAHFGRWRYTEAHNAIKKTIYDVKTQKLTDHIEVDESKFLKRMGKNVRYLSLNGISMIKELPESIGKLRKLMILDLRDCHNLEKLPQKPEPTIKLVASKENLWFEMLSILDITGCYLLDHIPKWIGDISNLQVLKGAVFNGLITDQCRLGDLSKLRKLTKLSIRLIHYELFTTEDTSALEPLDNLLVLTIVWGKKYPQYKLNSYQSSSKEMAGVKKDRRINKEKQIGKSMGYDHWWISKSKKRLGENKDKTILFPKNLKKLDLRCYPSKECSELSNAAKLENLNRLYIRGGMFTKFEEGQCYQNVHILRLRFLSYLDLDWNELGVMFPALRHVESLCCPLLRNFPSTSIDVCEKSIDSVA